MIELRFRHLRAVKDSLDHPADFILGIEADLEIVTEEGLVYAEPRFAVVELAQQLNTWLDDGLAKGQDFELDSMETEEPGWVWFRAGDAGWRIGSIHQDRIDLIERDAGEVVFAIKDFTARLEQGCQVSLGGDIRRFTHGRAAS